MVLNPRETLSAEAADPRYQEFRDERPEADGLAGVDDVCAVCGTQGAEHACGGCDVLRYCGQRCAEKHWRGYTFQTPDSTNIRVPGHHEYCTVFAKIDQDILDEDEGLARALGPEERTVLQLDEAPDTDPDRSAEPASIERWITDPATGISYWIDRRRNRVFWPLWGYRPIWFALPVILHVLDKFAHQFT